MFDCNLIFNPIYTKFNHLNLTDILLRMNSVFLLISTTLVVFMVMFVYFGFLSKVHIFKKYRSILYIFTIIIFILSILFVFSIKIDFLPKNLKTFCATAFGFLTILCGLTLLRLIALPFLNTTIRFAPSRRKFLKTCFDFGFFIMGVAMLIKGIFTAIKPPKINNIDIKIDGLKSNIRIAMISDVHIGDFLKYDFLNSIVDKINSLKVDMVVIVGDLVDANINEVMHDLSPLRDLNSKYGTYYVPGNHEYYHGVVDIMNYLSLLGVNVLKNEHIQIGGINLAGVLDYAGKNTNLPPNYQAALKDINPNFPTIMLAHQPRTVHDLDKNEYSDKIDLLLCGHTHAGQIFPFMFLVRIVQPYLYGLYRHNDKMQVYVSSGVGFWGPPVRVLAPSEIAILNLKGE